MARQIANGYLDMAQQVVASRLLRPLNTPLGVAILTLFAYGLFALARLMSFGGDVTRFVIAGDKFIPPRTGASANLSVLTNATGYDGQFYYLLALNPFSSAVMLPGAHFDLPAYRAQRILYPLLVWALSLGGRPSLVPTLLVIVNLSAIVAVGALGALLAQRQGVAPLWGVLLPLYPGLLVSLAGDLGEPLALACALAGLLCVKSHRWGWAALLLSLAALARETTALIAIALLVSVLLARVTPFPALRIPALRFIPREHWRGGLIAGLTPVVIALGWQIILMLRWGELGALAAGGNNIGIPFAGLLESLILWALLSRPALKVMLYADVGYLLGLAEMTRRLISRRFQATGYVAIAWILYGALALMLSVNVWDFYWNFLRGASELGMLSLLLLLSSPSRLRWAALVATLVVWGVTFFAIVPVGAPLF